MDETRRPSFPIPRPKTAVPTTLRRQFTAQGSRRLGIVTATDGRVGGIPTVVFSSHKLFVTIGGVAAFYSAALSAAPTHPVTVRPTNLPPGLRVSPSLHVFTHDDWRSPRVFRVAAPGSNLLDDHGGALASRDPHRMQTIDHVSSSMDVRFQSPRVLLVPPVVCVQVNTRLGCCAFASGQASGTYTRAGAATQAVVKTSVSATQAQSCHEFAEIELGMDDQAGRKALVARSIVLVQQQQPPTPPAAKTTATAAPRPASVASMAAMAAVEAANDATVRTVEMLERRRTRRSLLVQPMTTSTTGCAVNTSASLIPIDGVFPSGTPDTDGDFCAYSASGSLTHEAASNTIVRVASRASHSVLLFKGGALLSLGKLLEHDSAVVDPTSTTSAAVISLEAGAGADAALSRMLVDVACGDHHVVAITEQGYLLTWGDTRDGRLGHGTAGHPIMDNGERQGGSGEPTATTPPTVAMPTIIREPQVVRSLLHKRIVHVACGARHSIALAEDGDVFSWGHGACGALGHSSFETIDEPKSIESLRGQRVARVACGDVHTAVLLASGTLLTCGWSEHGRLGRACNPVGKVPRKASSDYFDDDDANDRRSSSYSPTLLPVEIKTTPRSECNGSETERCTYVTCGAAHTLLLTSTHRVLAFGWNVNGQLGVGDCRSRWTPTTVDYFEDSTYIISALAAGKLHSLAALQDGRMFAWGSDELGQCGVGSFPQIYTIPHLVTSVVGLHVSQLAAADSHSVVLTLGAQRHLDALEVSHPQRYAQLVERFEAVVQEDAARRALVFTRAREKQLRHEAQARKRKPMVVTAQDETAISALADKMSAAVAMAGTNTSLAKVLAMQARVDEDVAGFERSQASSSSSGGTTTKEAGVRRSRPQTAGAALGSSSWASSKESDGQLAGALVVDRSSGGEPSPSAESDSKEPEAGQKDADEPRQTASGSRPRTAGARRVVRCSSAALWRQSRLYTFESATAPIETPRSAPKKAHGKRPATSAGSARPSTASRMSKEARAQLGALLADGYDTERPKTSTVSTEGLREARGSALLSVALAAMGQQQQQQQQDREAAWFPVSRPKSAPSRARTTRA